MRLKVKLLTTSILTSLFLTSSVVAKEIKTNTAQMQALDKVTGRIKIIEVPVNGNVNFGTFSILVRDCQTRPPEEIPENFAFVDVVDNYVDGTKVNVFRGWMMSSTPGLNAVEHPIYDVWLLKCIDTEFDKSLILTDEELEARNNIQAELKETKGKPTNLLVNIVDEEEEKQQEESPITSSDSKTQEISIEEMNNDPSFDMPSEINVDSHNIEATAVEEIVEDKVETKPLNEAIVEEAQKNNEVTVRGLIPDNTTDLIKEDPNFKE